MVANDIIEQLEKLDAADGSMARMDAVSWPAVCFVLEIFIRTEFSAAERGNATLYKPVPDCWSLAVASLTSAALRDIIVSHRCRVEKSVGGDAAGMTWQDTVFRQGRCSHGAAARRRLFGQSLRPPLVCHLSIHGSQFASATPSCLRSTAFGVRPADDGVHGVGLFPPTRGEETTGAIFLAVHSKG
jgi:hypothetical protein